MAGSFPTGVTAYTNPGPTDIIGVDVGTRTLDEFVADHNDDLEQVMTKLGTGSSTAAANTVLRGTGSGASAFGQIATGDLAANAVSQSGFTSATDSISTNSTTYVAIGSPALSVTLTTTGGDVLVWFFGATAHTVADGETMFGVRLDSGTPVDLIDMFSVSTTATTMMSVLHKFSAPSAGSHTFEARWRVITDGTCFMDGRGILAVELKK